MLKKKLLLQKNAKCLGDVFFHIGGGGGFGRKHLGAVLIDIQIYRQPRRRWEICQQRLGVVVLHRPKKYAVRILRRNIAEHLSLSAAMLHRV